MADDNLVKAQEAIQAAESALKLAKQLISETSGVTISSGRSSSKSYVEKAASIGDPLSSESRVIEGVFNGQNMLDKNGTIYPVPANYASKSKLIPGDVLKLTVTEEGKFLYKQIGPVERKTIIGPLVYNDGQYEVLANNKAYKVLLASVTYFRAAVGDEVTLIIPVDDKVADWGAIEAVLPKFDDNNTISKADLGELNIDNELDI